MKHFIAASLIVAASFTAWAADPMPGKAPAQSSVTGEVLEIKDVDSYTYLRLKTKDGETWAAVTTAAVKKGATVTIENAMVMNNFESKTLKKTFPSIVFGSLGGAAAAAGTGAMGSKMAMASAADTTPIKVAKASGANAYTVADIVTKATQLKDKPVKVNGQVVKYNAGIMGKNWIHLRDGSGTAANNDVLVTTAAPAKVGDQVTVSGVVRNDKDFGAGYSYKVLIEDATLTPIKK
ncbi:MAG: hypothetical protein RLZZ371_2404 [Pseudomonadota bacterium]